MNGLSSPGQLTGDPLNLIRHLIKAEDLGIRMVKDGVVAGRRSSGPSAIISRSMD
jgi:hypothetical protein